MYLKFKKNILFIIKLIIIILVLKFSIQSIIVVVFSDEYEAYRKKMIIEQYENNRKEFNDSINELQEIYSIVLRKKGLVTEVIIFQDKKNLLEPGEGFKQINKKDYGKYKKTLKLMKKYKIKKVYKNDENVEFLYSLPPCWMQNIIFIRNKQTYPFSNEDKEIQKIDENWYYIR